MTSKNPENRGYMPNIYCNSIMREECSCPNTPQLDSSEKDTDMGTKEWNLDTISVLKSVMLLELKFLG